MSFSVDLENTKMAKMVAVVEHCGRDLYTFTNDYLRHDVD
jgi:hypothetical protein